MAKLASTSGDQDALLLSSLQVASQSWVSFDWNSRRDQWEKTLLQTKESREQSLSARKQLGETTKQFKRSVKNTEQASTALSQNTSSQDHVQSTIKAMDVLAKECRKTVKAYQEEIDNLTRRCKSSETAFSGLHSSLQDLPDPASMIGTAMDQIHGQQNQISQLLRTVDDVNGEMKSLESRMAQQADVFQKEITQLKAAAKKAPDSGSGVNKAEREELIQLRREVAEYEVEFRGLKNQDITIRKLEAKIADLQSSGEEQLQQELKKAQEELAETEGRRAADALEREAAMERKVQSLELELKAERAGREATQSSLLDADEGAGEREAAWEAQRLILVDDASRLRESLHEAVRERDNLRLQVAALGEGSPRARSSSAPNSGGITMADMMLERKAYEAEVSELSHTANSLREELRLKEDVLMEERQMMQETIDKLEHEKVMLSSSVASLETQVASAPSQIVVENMKRELRILKRLEYNADDVDAEKDPEMTTSGEESDLESVLVAKMRRLESDIVKERTQKLEFTKELEDMQSRLDAAETAKGEADNLVAKLEADLEKAIATPISTSAEKKRETSEFVPTAEDPATLQHILDPDAPPPSGGVPPPPKVPLATSKAVAEKASDDHSVATIVMAQRDRLRARCEALEAERDSFKRELQVQVCASESLKSDNTKLYEKVRYLQNFGSKSGPGGRANSNLSDRDLDLEALEQRYEASVDPFKQFSRAERQRKMREMSPVERTVFIVARTVLGSKEMRTGLFFYVVGLHLLVFVTTYHWSHSGCETYQDKDHLAHLPPALPETVQKASKAVADAAASTDAAASKSVN
mmetsp:Transcript_16311/g.23000  ORF Transcript_16311/g.23000 Transcript_16311/m.23000 type:complete len:819 (-) Transcript_16311:232-2688(-)